MKYVQVICLTLPQSIHSSNNIIEFAARSLTSSPVQPSQTDYTAPAPLHWKRTKTGNTLCITIKFRQLPVSISLCSLHSCNIHGSFSFAYHTTSIVQPRLSRRSARWGSVCLALISIVFDFIGLNFTGSFQFDMTTSTTTLMMMMIAKQQQWLVELWLL